MKKPLLFAWYSRDGKKIVFKEEVIVVLLDKKTEKLLNIQKGN